MKNRVADGLKWMALTLIVALPTGVAFGADQESDPDLVMAVMRELFPEVESQAILPGGPSEPVGRLTAAIPFDSARARARQAFESGRTFHGDTSLWGFADRTRTRDISITVAAPGGRLVGSAVISRKGKGIQIDIFQFVKGEAIVLPARRALPEPVMWLFPMVTH